MGSNLMLFFSLVILVGHLLYYEKERNWKPKI